MRRLREQHGEHFAESYASKLSNTYFIVAQKEAKPGQVRSNDLWFDNLGVEVPEEKQKLIILSTNDGSAISPSESRSIIVARSRRKGGKPSAHKNFEADREVVVDKSGIVQSIKKLRGKKDD